MRNIKFINDKVVKKILTSEDKENKEYLIRIISGVTGIDKDLLRSNKMISVSYLKSKYNKLETIKKIDESIADAIHVDLMDGVYVENKNFSIEILISKETHSL